jgi:8-oxo-dGTP diphosphatase
MHQVAAKATEGRHPAAAMARSSKLVASKKGRVLLVQRRGDKLWMFPGGRKRADMPSLRVFPGYLQPELDAGKVFIDSTHFVADTRHSGSRPGRSRSHEMWLTDDEPRRIAEISVHFLSS